MQVAIVVAERVAGERIERAERLVHQHDPRPCRQRPRDADALALAAGQFVRKAVAVLARGRAAPGRAARRPARRSPPPAAEQLRRDPDIVGDAHVRKQPAALEHIADAAAQRDRIDRAHVLALDRDVAARRRRSAGWPAAAAWSCRSRSRRRWRGIRPRRPRARRRPPPTRPRPPSKLLPTCAKAIRGVFGIRCEPRAFFTLPWRGRVGSHRAKQDASRGGVKVSQHGRRSRRETVTPPRRSFHSRRPSPSRGG